MQAGHIGLALTQPLIAGGVVVGAPVTFEVAENVAFELPLAPGVEGGTWSLESGLDASEFALVDGVLTLSAQDFETDVSVGQINVYECVVRYTLGSQITDTRVSGTILDEDVEILVAPPTSLSTYPNSDTAPSVTVNIPVAVNVTVLAFAHKASNCAWTCAADAEAMTQLVASVTDEAGANFNSQAIFRINNPPAGSLTVTATPSDGVGAAARRGLAVLVLASVDPLHLVVGAPFEDEGSPGQQTTSATDIITTTEPDSVVFGMISGSTTATAFTSIDFPDGTTGYQPVSTSSTSAYGVFYRRVNSPGAQSFNNWGFLTSATSGGATTADDFRRIQMLTVALKGLVHQDQLPVWYFSQTGDDGDDGFSEAAPKKSVEALEGLMPLPAGGRVRIKSGETIRRETPVSAATPLLSISHLGTEAEPVIFETYGGDEPGWIGGDIVYASGWAAATEEETNATAVSLGAETRAMGTTSANKPRAWFPCIDGKMLEPCSWSASPLADANGHPSAIDAWDDTYDGSDSFDFIDPEDVQEGDTYDPTKKVRWTISGDDTHTVTIEHPDIAAHYGSASPAGAVVSWRQDGNQTIWSRITEYDQGASTITFVTEPYSPHSTFFWAIIGHPLDLVKVGQFAWSTDDSKVHPIWPAGTVKSVARTALGVAVNSSRTQFSNVGVCNTAAEDAVSTDAMFKVGPGVSHGVCTDLHFKQALNPARPSCVATASSGAMAAGWTFTDTVMEDCRHHSGFRMQLCQGWHIDGLRARRLGRTIVSCSGQSTGNLIENVDGCDHFAIHGNLGSEYQQANDNEIYKVGGLGVAQGLTAQMQGAVTPVASKSSSRRDILLSSVRPISTTPGVPYDHATPLVRIDGSDTDGAWDRILLALGKTGMYLGVEQDQVWSHTENIGTRIERSSLLSLASEEVAGPKYGLRGVEVDAVLVSSEPVPGGSEEDWDDHEAIVTNSEVDPTQLWVGAMSDKMWEYMTRDDARAGYQAIQLGPDAWDWQIPAYGGVRTMVDLRLSTTRVRANRQVGKTIGSVIGGMPGSTFSLPAGQGDNDLGYWMIDRGVMVVTALMPAGTYDLVVRESNASASNGPTRNTTIQIEVE